jgi:group I intron endonuclease
MSKICGIYKITNIVNNKCIIGQSVNIKTRWRDYKNKLRKNRHYNVYLQRSWNKYGENNFKFEIILECPKKQISYEEIRLIKEYKSMNKKYGYNLTEGGEGGIPSQEIRKKMSEAKMGTKLSEETKRRMSFAAIGIPKSKEHCKRISIARKGMRFSEETKRRMSKPKSEETKQKLREWNTGRKKSKETKQKIREALRGKKRTEKDKIKIREGWARHKNTQNYFIYFLFSLINPPVAA